jgi:hypothetical protein
MRMMDLTVMARVHRFKEAYINNAPELELAKLAVAPRAYHLRTPHGRIGIIRGTLGADLADA